MLQIDQSVSNSERYKYRTEAKVKVSLPAIKQYLRDETAGGSIQHLCHKAGFVTQNVLYYLRKGEIPESIFVKVFGEIPDLPEYMATYEKMMTIIEPAEQPKQTTETAIPAEDNHATPNQVLVEIVKALGNKVFVQINCTDICEKVSIQTLNQVMDTYKGKCALMSVFFSELGVEPPRLSNIIKMNNIKFKATFEDCSVKFIVDWSLQ